ncbi:MAG: hypothetical protein PHR82_00105 [Endomicrobiaceae bacterium]|nr:hypothetical protein [Endomicrobiaceae bacterium]
MFKSFISSLLCAFLLCSCGPSYPKETLVKDIEKLVKKESGCDTKVYLVKDTVYLDMPMEQIVSSKNEVFSEAIIALQNGVFAITRIALSSDADIKIIVITAFDPQYNVSLRMIQNIEDVKSYFYQRISRGDYEQRQLIEIEGPDTARQSILDKHYVSQEEFVGRLIVSQINILGKTNPFLATVINSLNLKYDDIDNDKIIITAKGTYSLVSETLIKKLIHEELDRDIKKYKLFTIKYVRILSKEGTVVLEVPAVLN